MKPGDSLPPGDISEEVTALIATLHDAQHRLEVLTEGEVDAVADRDGRTFLLRRAQEQLRRTEADKQAAILNALPAHIAVLDAQGMIVSVNDAWRRFGAADAAHSPGHGVGLNYLDICDSAEGTDAVDAHEAAAGIRSVLNGGLKRFSIGYPCHSPVEQRWFLMTATPLGDDFANGAVVMHLDVTERRRSEEESRRFSSAMDATADAIYLVDRASMRFIHVNDAACRMQQMTREAIMELGPAGVLSVPPDELARTYDAIIASGVEAAPLELLRPRRDGSEAWVEIRRQAQLSDNRWTIVTLVRDVTERRRTAQELLESEARFRSLTKLSSDWFWEQDGEHRFRSFSGGDNVEGWGPDQAKAVGLHRWDLGGVVPISSDWEEHRRILDAHQPFRNFEYQRILGDGRLQYVAASGEPIFDQEGRFTGYRGVATEITARKEADIRIRRLNRVYAVLSGITTLMVRTKERDELLRDACQIAVVHGGYLMAWVGMVDREAGLVRPIASAGDVRDFLDVARLGIVEAKEGYGLAGRAVQTRMPVLSNDVPNDRQSLMKPELRERGINSLAIVPLLDAEQAVGVLALYAAEVGAFDAPEIKLLLELAGDISFAIANIESAAKLGRVTRMNAMLSGINGAIVRIRGRQGLFEEACRIAVETGGLPFAWLGVVDEVEMRLRLVASAGGDADFLTTIGDRLSLRDDAPSGYGLAARSVREKCSLTMNDAVADAYPKYRKSFAERGIRSVAAFPLLIAGRAIGTFALHSTEPGFFDADEMNLLNEVAANIAFALEHMEKEEKVRRLTRVYAVLSGINALIVRMNSREDLFSEACRIAVADGGFLVAWLGIVDRSVMKIIPAASAGDNRELISAINDLTARNNGFELGDNIAARSIMARKAIVSNDSQNDPDIAFRDIHTRSGIRSMAVLPLLAADEAQGALALYSAEAGFFDEEEMKLLTELARNIAFAVDHIVRAEKLGRMTRVNAMLSDINGAIVRIRGRQELFEEACRIALETGGMSFAWIGVADASGKQLQLVASAGRDDGFLQTIRNRLALPDAAPEAQGLSTRALREGCVVVVNDVAADPVINRRKAFADRGIKAVAIFPFFIAGRAVGTFALHSEQAGFFDDDEMRLLHEVAANIAFALEHMEKEEKVRRLTRVYAVLSGINALIVRATDRDELFKESCRIAVEHGKFAMAWVGAFDPVTQDVTPVAWAGEAAEELTRAKSSAREGTPRGTGAVGQSIRARRPIFNNNILTQAFGGPRLMEIMRLGFQSHITLPLYEGQAIVATLTLYTKEQGFFDEDEVRLLTELAADISFALENISRQHKLDYLAYYDELTGLANRRLFLERVAQHMRGAVTGGHKLAVFLVDIERFKSINDSLGQAAGDALLRHVGNWLTLNLGGASLLARIGADHFALVLPEVKHDSSVARLVDKTLAAFMAHPFCLDEAVFRLSAKVGVALFPDDATDADTLLKNAEAALKKAKASGERYLFYQQQMTDQVAGKLTLENQLRRALENEEFVLHYQPKVSLESGKVTAAEALIRWNDPQTGLVPPGKFIPVLEETGLIYDVGRWALRKALSEYLRWRAAGLPAVRIAVNVSPLQLRNRGFSTEIQQLVGIDPLAPAGLELEITESVIMEDVKSSIASLQAIRAMGVTIAIDDFGTGFSSLSHLARLPVDALKIDRSFVMEMTSDAKGLSLIQTIIGLAHSLKLKVVAEGVETEEQSRLLRLLRCDEMQGFLFSKPVPADLFEERFLAKRANEPTPVAPLGHAGA